MFVEVKVQIFIRIIDAQLFEAVFSKVLKPKDVQDGDRGGLFGSLVNNVVNTSNKPGEQRTVQCFSKSVPRVESLVDVQRRY